VLSKSNVEGIRINLATTLILYMLSQSTPVILVTVLSIYTHNYQIRIIIRFINCRGVC